MVGRWYLEAFDSGSLRGCLVDLAVDFSEDDVDRADDGDDVGEEAAYGEDFEGFEVHEGAGAFVPAVGAVGAVSDDIEAEFSFRSFDSGVGFSGGGSEPFGVEFEVVDDALHGVVELVSGRGGDFSVEGVVGAAGEAVDGLAEDAAAFLHFGDADKEAVVDVSNGADGDLEVEVLVAGVGLLFPEVEGDSAGSGDGSGASEGE